MPSRITEEILAEIVGIAADAVICMDEFQRVTFFNKGAETIFGWTPEEIVGQRIEVLMPERFRNHHARQVAEFGRSNITARRMGERREIAGLRKSGEEFPAEAAISQVHQDGSAIYAVVLRDVTLRKKFESRQEFLASAGERLASSFGSGETLENVVALAVPALADAAILENRTDDGYRAGAVMHSDPEIMQTLELLTHHEIRKPREEHPLTQILHSKSPVVYQDDASAHIARVSNSRVYIEAIEKIGAKAALYLPLVARGQMIGVLSLFRRNRPFDSDDLVFAEDLGRLAALALDNARLLDAVKSSLSAREEMVGVVSHDLRNPVAAVRMLSKVVLADLKAREPDAAGHVALIVQAADQMDALIRDLLDLTRIDARKLAIAPDAVDPSSLLTDSLQTLLPLIEAKHISLDMQIEAGLSKVLADPERIQQTLSNLVGNAIKFSPERGTIVVAAARDGSDYIRISVSDNGPGIAPDHLPKVFDRYWQSSRTDRQGAGLGLAIARGIVEAHGGRIWLDSQPGRGTTASFSLPLFPG